MFVASSHDELLFFTNLGRVYNLRVFEVPEGSRIAKGRAVVNILPLQDGERVVKLLCARDMENKFFVMITKGGVIKRTQARLFLKIRSTGIRALSLRENDELVFCSLSTGEDSVIVATKKGQGIHFKETEVRDMGRQAAGVRAIRLKANDIVVGMEVIHNNEGDVLFATEKGYGKRVQTGKFRLAHRGGVGVRTIPTGTRNGSMIGLAKISDNSHVLLIDVSGKIIRLDPAEIRTMGRHAQGVRLIRLDKTQKLIGVVSFEDEEEEPESSSTAGEGGSVETEKLETKIEVVEAEVEVGADVDPDGESLDDAEEAIEESDDLKDKPAEEEGL